MSHADFLFELGTEELPPKSLQTLQNALRDSIVKQLAQLSLAHGEVTAYATPRRLTVIIDQLQLQQDDRQESRRGPSLSAPEKAAQGFARSCGVELSELAVIDTEKGQYYSFDKQVAGASTKSLLAAVIEQALADLPIAKRMRWGQSRAEFVRPVQWFILMLGETLVDCSLFNLNNGNQTRGHRFHCLESITIDSPKTYAQQLRNQGKVIVDIDERKQIIRTQVAEQAAKVGAQAVINENLLNEVSALVEWPVCLCGKFDEAFLAIPAQALVSSMAEHQKYFHLVDNKGEIQPYFITVSNLISKSPESVIAGNERVIRPRLADAAFFFETDKKTTLESRNPALEKVVFQADLGSLADKTHRIAALAGTIANQIGANADQATRAGLLAKADLNTEMVLEFGDLQGLMGHVYALNDGEDTITAEAIEQHYWPKFAGDKLPQSLEASALALADRLDTLVGLFGIKQPPTGSKDPYALRRATVGLLRIMIEQELELDLLALINNAYSLHVNLKQDRDTTRNQLHSFIIERLRAYYDDQDIKAEVYLAVNANKPSSPLDFDRRVKAVNHFLTLASSGSLAEANKRVSNILLKNGNGNDHIDAKLLVEADEKALNQALIQVSQANQISIAKGDYQSTLSALANLADPLEAFFASTMVMADDESVKNNRLALLSGIQTELARVADIALLAQ
ncbi:MAG: glycine--tRNA ligase subunit beta [Gammaproteobacteria bacterium]|jgi:glycyl-tRNA synthetase beta chain|nr:glycine--tRNA ligase subunit beta [Gammaproteobacteria bacterium]